VCIQYHNLVQNEIFDLKLDTTKKVTVVVHGKITGMKEATIKMKFSESSISHITLAYLTKSERFRNLPFQVTSGKYIQISCLLCTNTGVSIKCSKYLLNQDFQHRNYWKTYAAGNIQL